MLLEPNRKTSIKHHAMDAAFILAGIFSAAFGFKGFLLPNEFTDGGATGISLLSSAVTGIPLYILIIIINAPFIAMGWKTLGKTFAQKTILAILGLAVVLALVQFPTVTNDKLLTAIFGGFFLGMGIGLAVRGGSVIDGTEVLAIYLGRKIGATIGDIVLIINIIIFSCAAWLLGLDIAMYSMITYLSASKTLDFVVEGIEEYVGVTIVSTHCESMQRMISEKLGRGVTVYSGKKGYGKRGENTEIDIIYTVITRLEINKIKRAIDLIDADAFVVMNSVKETKGGIIKQRPLQHD
ncbi:MAG: YitT family protein [Sphingomonadales bacterium]|nr:YitT family protein [Sphingomonadales bacterium]